MEKQIPLISKGAVIEISGHKAIVTKITKEGVQIQLQEKTFVVDFNKVEEALKQAVVDK